MAHCEDFYWTTQSTVSNITSIDLIFQLSPGFFSNPETPNQATTIALPMLPSASRRSGEYTSSEAFEHLDELVRHYRTVLRLADQYALDYTDYFYHFWLRLRLRSEEAEIEFAGFDTWGQIKCVFSWLEKAESSALSRKAIDRWNLRMARIGDHFHFIESGVNRSSRQTNLAFPRIELLSHILSLRERSQAIIDHLIREIGDDYWSDYRRDLT